MDQEFFERQFAVLRDNMNARFDGIEKRMDGIEKCMDGLEKRMDGLEKRMDGLEKRMDGVEAGVKKIAVEMEAMRADIRLIAEGHVMLSEKFLRFETEHIRHAIEMRQDILNLYKVTFGQLERRVKELESVKQ